MPNPGVTTLATIRTLAAQEADQPTPTTTTFISTSEWTSYINGSYFELYDLLVQKYGDDYFSALDSNGDEYRITTNGTADHYPLPNGSNTYLMPDGTTTAPAFYKLLGVDLYMNGTDKSSRIRVYPFMYAERNQYSAPNIPAWGGRIRLKYRLEAGYLWLIPLPAAGQKVGLRYVPRLTPLSGDGDLVDGVSGWEEYIVVDAAMKAMAKEESDVSVMMARKQALLARIEMAAENRDAGSPATVVDVRGEW